MKETAITFEELFKKHNGATVTMDGHKYKVEYSEYKAIYPYKHLAVHIYLTPTAAEKKTEWYLSMKRKLGDDWSTDAKSLSDKNYIEVHKQLAAKK